MYNGNQHKTDGNGVPSSDPSNNYQDGLQHGNNAGLKVMQRQKKRGVHQSNVGYSGGAEAPTFKTPGGYDGTIRNNYVNADSSSGVRRTTQQDNNEYSYPTHSNAMHDLLEPNTASEISPELFRRSNQLNLLPGGQ